MIVAFHYRQPFTRQLAMGEALKKGLGGDEIAIIQGGGRHAIADALVLYGVGGISRDIWDAYEGKPRILIDKGYARKGFMRVTINEFHPLKWLAEANPPADRLLATGWDPIAYGYGDPGDHVLLDALSGKYCHWMKMDRFAWIADTIRAIRSVTDMPILFRPRPSHNPAPPVPEGTILDEGPLSESLAKSAFVVSHGGNLGCDAVIAGRPHVALGPSPALCLSSKSLKVEVVPTDAQRHRWMKALAYCQYSMDEIADGTMWKWVRAQL